MNCPKCNKPDAEECVDEIDIGVGIQKFLWGAVCSDCGQLYCCGHCGAWDWKPEPHYAWCVDARGN